jgi:hypothetical protein
MPASSRSPKACTECRQVKLRCDSRQNFPDPCSRCNARGLACTFDPLFKRVPTKDRVERLTNELELLRRAQGHLDVPSIVHGRSSSASSPLSEYSRTESLFVSSTLPTDPEHFFGLSDLSHNITVFRLGSFQIDLTKVKQCFLHFSRHQIKHLPIVDVRRHYVEMHSTTPFLFWSIIVVAIRTSTVSIELLDEIEGPYNEFLGRVLVKSPLSLSSVQGLLILCMWPFPVKTQRQDPAWNLCNVALSSITQLGMPGKILQKDEWATEEEQATCRTWLGCFYVGCRLASNLAVPPPLRTPEDLRNVTKALAIAGNSGDFSPQLEIQRQAASHMSVLSSDQAMLESSSAIQIYDGELNTIPAKFKGLWTRECDLSLLIAKLQLYTFVILSTKTDRTKEDLVTGAQNPATLCLLKGFNAAVSLTSLYSQMLKDLKQTSKTNIATTATHLSLPKSYHVSFAQATFFLMRFVAGPDTSTSDRDVARNQIKFAKDLFLQHSQRPDDEAERAARLIETLTTASADTATHSDSDPHILRIVSRKAATVRGRPSSYDQPAPEAVDESSNHGLGSASNMPFDTSSFDQQYNSSLQLYSGLSNDFWDLNYAGMMPPMGDWMDTSTFTGYST